MTNTDTRRRGAALEEAILDAAWSELLERGYNGFTMDSVAARAETSRPVLARRWENRASLAVAAITNFVRKNPVEAPILGNVRDELVALLQNLSNRDAATMVRALLSMSDYFLETDTSFADLRKQIAVSGKLSEVLARGVDRGELDASKLTPKVASLPVDLVGHAIIMTRKPVSTEAIEEIVDTIFLPLASSRA